MDCKTRADLPYPEPDINIKSVAEVKLLMPLYGGREGELTAILTYIYGSYILPDRELAECFRKIAITEMHHHATLGKLINMLGGTPYMGGNYSYWQGGYVNYVKDPLAVVKNSLSGELQAIHDYKFAINKTSLPEIREILERIVIDEEAHRDTLNHILDTYKW